MVKTRIPQPSETNIQAGIMQYLRMRGFYVQRMNSGAIRDKTNRLVRMNKAGTPDLLAIKHGKCLFIEVKRPSNKPTPLQIAVMEELQSFGAKCLVATNIEAIEAYLNNNVWLSS